MTWFFAIGLPSMFAISAATRRRSTALLASPCSESLNIAQYSKTDTSIFLPNASVALWRNISKILFLEYGSKNTSDVPILERTRSSRL